MLRTNPHVTRRPAVLLGVLVAVYAVATLPHLGDYPPWNWDEGDIVAPARKLASEGIFGNDLYQGYSRHEERNYQHMPLYPLAVALSFELFGAETEAARLVSALCGLAVVLLTYLLGRQIRGPSAGLLAAAALCLLSVSLLPHSSGMPLLDAARIARYDVMVPVGVLAACCVFLWSESRRSRLGYLASGLCVGLATLAHVYAPAILLVFTAVLLWRKGWRALAGAEIYLLAGGWLAALLPWLAYVARDVEAFAGQMRKWSAMGRFAVWEPAFFVSNLLAERQRYLSFVVRDGEILLFPRVGIWVLAAGIAAATFLLLRRSRDQKRTGDRLLLLALPGTAGLLAVITHFKIPTYTSLVVPFLALQVAVAANAALRSRRRWLAGLTAAALLGAAVEGGSGIAASLARARSATPYLELTGRIARHLEPGSRILLSKPYALGLAEFETRSVYLPFYRSNPAYNRRESLTLTEVMDGIAPDYILADAIVEPDFKEPPGPGVEAQRVEFERYLRQRCGTVVTRFSDPSYGRITLYRCDQITS